MHLFICLLSLLHLTSAQRYIRSTSLLTCMEDSEFSSTYFDLTFYPGNHTAVFDIDATSLINGKIKAVYSIVVYGLNVYEDSLDLCDLDYSTVCPISSGKFNVEGTYSVDASISDQLPGVTYTIPDLDAYVKVVVYYANDTDNSEPLACVKAVLGNGKTVQTRYAGWPIAIVSGFGLVVSSFVSILGHSATAAHIASNAASLFIYFQNLAIFSMLGVGKVPPIAASWAQNFQWSIGVIKTSFMQQMIYWYVQSTGGSVTSTLANKSVLSISVQKLLYKFKLIKRISLESSDSLDDVLNDTALYTTDEEDVNSKTLVLRGIQRVAYLSNIEISNIFMTAIIFFLFTGFVLLVLLSLFKATCELLVLSGIVKNTKLVSFRAHWRSIMKGALYRLFFITFPTLTFFCIWEFTRHDSAGCVVFAVVIIAVAMVLMCYAATRILLAGYKSTREFHNPAYILFGDEKVLNRFGFLYSQYKASMYYWVAVSLFHLFLRALLIAVLQNQGKVAACLVFAIEVIYTVVLIWKRPFMDKRTNVFNIFISVINVVNSIFYLFFSNVFKQPAVVSSVAAVVYFVLNAVVALILLIMTIVTCTLALIRKNPDTRYEPLKDDRLAFIPNSDPDDKVEYELAALGATAMRGHDRNSMFAETNSTKEGIIQSPEANKKSDSLTTNSLNPFAVEEDRNSFVFNANQNNSTLSQNDNPYSTSNQGYDYNYNRRDVL
ncbi:hypothetical protein CANARDRAFT_198405 [[Candida] arabinofermentans NRRL YB-2248]|uniref:ML-like domain-containing protein n=1 Tax=[Candida] arabinofermentans NRRL YB-2248 TaxID=983967 RepID=A0A1E4T126_9ASCO|nr:hypothetical protein CANARDRAFT_198405 [[Candida] arabinofermentans NRRL YB-2248]